MTREHCGARMCFTGGCQTGRCDAPAPGHLLSRVAIRVALGVAIVAAVVLIYVDLVLLHYWLEKAP